MVRRFGRITRLTTCCVISGLLLSGCSASPYTISINKHPVTYASSDSSSVEEGSGYIDYSGDLHIQNGCAEPMLNYSYPDTANSASDILRFCVYVETDHDTDGDGMKDLVKVFAQVPRSAAEGCYKAAAIYDPMPYSAGITDNNIGYEMFPYADKNFDYDTLYSEGESHPDAAETDTLSAAVNADPSEYLYRVPISGDSGYNYIGFYDYYLVRGFAVIEACGLGSYGSEGFQLNGLDLERDAAKCVVEWLAGDRKAYTDRECSSRISADWCNGNVAMTGCSYGGTIPFEVAETGVKGLKTIIPIAGVASWYDYVNSQGITVYGTDHYNDILAALCAGGCYLDDSWRVINPSYAAYLNKIATDQTEAHGLFAPIWQMMECSEDYDGINCPALIVQGLNDFNVRTNQAEHMYNAFRSAGQNVKLLLHQDGHKSPYGRKFGDRLFDEIMNRWLCHYLYDVDNGIEDMPEITIQSNVDGSFYSYDTFPATESVTLSGNAFSTEARVWSDDLDGFYDEYVKDKRFIDRYYLEQKVFDLNTAINESVTFIGRPEVHIRLKADDTDKDNLMVTAVLLDTMEDGDTFEAYMIGNTPAYTLPYKQTGSYEICNGHPEGTIDEGVQSLTNVKAVTYGWTNLRTPDRGKDLSEYTEESVLEDRFYDYHIYLQPTVYTLQPGHVLKLSILANDPQRVLADEILDDDTPNFRDDYVDPDYSFTIDEKSLEVSFDVIK